MAALAWVAVGCLSASGCQRASEAQYASSAEVDSLEAPLQATVRKELDARCGTPQRPKLLGADGTDLAHLERGARVYQHYCVPCHGASGGGDGLAAEYLTPRPRDYRRGVFKFISTGYGNRPRRQDLLRTVTNGIAGTSMPSFRRLEKRDLEAVIDYVLVLTHRGELERMLAAQAANEGELTDEDAQAFAEAITEQWRAAADQELEPATKMPPFTPESVALGAEAFKKRDCFKCHGRDGRGGLAGGIDVGVDAWGHKDPAADLTSGMLHGGQTPDDVYRRIYGGINGTPMPAFKDALAAEPDTIWHLAHYVLHLANQRRRGVQIAQGGVAQPAAPSAATSGSGNAAPPATKPDDDPAASREEASP